MGRWLQRARREDGAALVETARAGLAASFPDIDGERGLNLSVSIAPGLPPLIADGTRIVQVLYNLLSNAARFSEPGDEVKLGIGMRGERMVFTVEDSGTAPVDELRASLADRADLPGAGRQQNAGIGFAIVRAFVNMHGGTIGIERRGPRGTRVIVSLPSDVAMAGAAE